MKWSEFKQMVEEKLKENSEDDATIDYFDFSNASFDVTVYYDCDYNTIAVH